MGRVHQLSSRSFLALSRTCRYASRGVVRGKTWLQPVRNGADKLSNWLALLSSTKAYPTVGPLVFLVIGDVFSVRQLRCACRVLRGLFDWFVGIASAAFG